MSRRRGGTTGSSLRWFGYGLGLISAAYICWIVLRGLFGQSYSPDRLNIVLYDDAPVLLSLGLSDNVNYVVSFSHDDKVYIPGGYGRYRVGALGKLAHLQKDPDLISRAFSSMVSAHVDFSIAPKTSKVYEDMKGVEPDFTALTVAKHLASQSYSFDGGFFDKLHVLYKLTSLRSSDFVPLKGTFKEDPDGDIVFSEKRFQKKYRGFFYHKSLRNESQTVQIESSTYLAGVIVSRIVEGQGIRVVDVNGIEEAPKKCEVVYQSSEAPLTARYLAYVYGCTARTGKVEGADILLRMDERLDAKWK